MAIFNSFLYVYQRVSPVKNMFFWDFLGFSHDSLTIVWPSNSWGPGHAGHSGSEGESPLADLGDSHGINEVDILILTTAWSCAIILYIMYIYIYSYISTPFCTTWSTSAFPAAEAFKKLLREWHPDKNVDRVQVCTAVFQCLSDAIPGEALGLLGIRVKYCSNIFQKREWSLFLGFNGKFGH